MHAFAIHSIHCHEPQKYRRVPTGCPCGASSIPLTSSMRNSMYHTNATSVAAPDSTMIHTPRYRIGCRWRRCTSSASVATCGMDSSSSRLSRIATR